KHKIRKIEPHEIKVFELDFMRFIHFKKVLSQPLFNKTYSLENLLNAFHKLVEIFEYLQHPKLSRKRLNIYGCWRYSLENLLNAFHKLVEIFEYLQHP